MLGFNLSGKVNLLFQEDELFLPDESCRKCGGLLLNYLICAKCRAPVKFVCRICGMKTLERFHDGLCFRPDNGINMNKNIQFAKHTIK